MDFKNVISFAAGCAGIAAFAGSVPEVTVTEFSQADDRTVTVKYSLVNAPAVVTMDVETNGPSGWVSIGGEAICGTYGAAPTGDVWKKIDNDGTDYKITWHPDLTRADHKITDNNARVVVTAWALDNTPDYMAINLASSGDDAIRYYPGAGFVPGGVLGNKAYRTTSLLMRKIMAKGVTYTMGVSETEIGYNGAREDFREVDMTNNFYIGVFEVTQTQWAEVMTWRNPCAFTNDCAMRPVEFVAYTAVRGGNANLYPVAPGGWIEKLNAKVPGMEFDLPSEAQWEWAACAGNPMGYWNNGVMITHETDDTNCPGRYKQGPRSPIDSTPIIDSPNGDTPPSEGGTAICGTYPPNDWGLYDMCGNVWEFCVDWYSQDTEKLKALRGAPNANGSNMLIDEEVTASTGRIARGGSYSYTSRFARPRCRHNGVKPATKQQYTGFRLICRGGLK